MSQKAIIDFITDAAVMFLAIVLAHGAAGAFPDHAKTILFSGGAASGYFAAVLRRRRAAVRGDADG